MDDLLMSDCSECELSDTSSVFSEAQPIDCDQAVAATSPVPSPTEECRETRKRRKMYELIREKELPGFQYNTDDLRLTLCIRLRCRSQMQRIEAMFDSRNDKKQKFADFFKECVGKNSDEAWTYEADSKFESAVKSIECSKLFVQVGPEKYETIDEDAVAFRGSKFTLCHNDFSKTLECFGNQLICAEFRHFVSEFEVERRNKGLPRPDECFLQSLKFQDGKYHITWGN